MPTKVVITGGPGTGKTSIVNILRKRYIVEPESARLVLTRNKLFKHHTAVQVSGLKLQDAIWNLELHHYKNAIKSKRKIVFFDRGYFDGFAYAHLKHLHKLHKEKEEGKLVKYDYVFMLNPLPSKYYANDGVRAETYTQSKKIHNLIINTYKKFGYKPINVPFDTVENRAKFILQHIKK